MIETLFSVIVKRLLVLMLCLWALPSLSQTVELEHKITEIRIIGAVRTDPIWIKDYLGLHTPLRLTDDNLTRLRTKLTTTDIFKEVDFTLRKNSIDGSEQALDITICEKWTTIPVMRATYGGGTPLTVVGLYDTNGFGRLWTLGGEMHKYGNAPIGGVLWARAPRWQQGYHMLDFELWNDFRVRTLYDKKFSPLGEFTTNIAMARGFLLLPAHPAILSNNGADRWQYGIDLKTREQRVSSFRATQGKTESPPPEIAWTTHPLFSSKILPTLVYDNIAIDGLRYDGQRLILNLGPVVEPTTTASAAEVEWFYYKSLGQDHTLASHVFAGSVSSHEPVDLYFLGGFDSIRGLPDGALFGNHAVYANLELRRVLFKFKYVWLQSALFSDIGNSASDTTTLFHNFYTTVGTGIRIFFPYVYRLAFRIDYGISLNDSSLGGFNAGMNDFFHPYRPL